MIFKLILLLLAITNGAITAFEGATPIGDACTDHVDCVGEPGVSSGCLSNICACFSDFVAKGDKLDCLPKRNDVGEDCIENAQCQEGQLEDLSICTGTPPQCQCDAGALQLKQETNTKKCFRIATSIEDPCEANGQCTPNLGDDAQCSNQICSCDPLTSVPKSDNTQCIKIINEIGGECKEDEQCKKGLPGTLSECRENVCACKEDAVSAGHVCYQKSSLVGDPCQVNEQCSESIGENSECREDEGKCRCTIGHVPTNDKTTCLPGPVLIGDPCQDNGQCLQTGARCSISGKCTCSNGFVASLSREDCLPIRNQLGDSCQEGQQCKQGEPGEWSDCLEEICKCRPEATEGPASHKCYRKAESVGDQCEIDDQCQTGLGYSRCVSGFCACTENASPSTDRTKCVLKVKLGETCEDSGQCSHIVHRAECLSKDPDDPNSDKVCACSPGYFTPDLLSDVCYKLGEQIGDSCEDHDSQCRELDGSSCIMNETKSCHCNYLTEVVSKSKTKCLKIITELDKECVETVQCEVEHSQCLASAPGTISKCVCTPDAFVKSENEMKCLEIVRELHAPCEESIQCTEGIDAFSECNNNNECDCKSGYKEHVDGHCYSPSKLNEGCNSDEECIVGVNSLTICTDAYCRCNPQAVPSEDGQTCLRKVYLGEECEENGQCSHIPSASCQKSIVGSGSVCKCNEGFQSGEHQNNACHKLATQIGESCEQHLSQCSKLPGARCVMNGTTLSCHCDYLVDVPSEDQKSCLQIVKDLNGLCKESVQCSVENSKCSLYQNELRCQCKENYIESVATPGRCIEVANHLNSSCQEDIQCTTGIDKNARCLVNMCKCAPGTTEHNGFCIKRSSLNETCEDDIECVLGVNNLSVCSPSSRQCVCVDDASPSRSGTICVPNVRIGESCFDDGQCSHIINSGGCRLQAGGGSVCQCEQGYVSSTTGVACYRLAAGIGEPCEIGDIQCSSLEQSYCDERTKSCLCLPGYSPGQSNLICSSGDSNMSINILLLLLLLPINLF